MPGVARTSLLVHYASFISCLAVVTCDYAYMNLPAHQTYAGRFKYLTFLSFLVGLMYHNMAAVFDFLAWSRERDSALWRKIRDYFFTTIVFPLTMFVCLMFWLLYTLNPDFMRPPEEDKLIPAWMTHGYHTLPILTVFIQAYTIQHNYLSKKVAFVTLFVFNGLYIAWIFWIAHEANFWVYPLFEKMSKLGISMFITACTFLTLGLYLIGKKFNDFIWGNAKEKSN